MAKRNKYILLVLIFIFFDYNLNSQKVDIIVSEEAKTETTILNNQTFKINLNENDLKNYKSKGFISYGDMGAVGDGKSDDINLIIATHHIANKYGLAVRANIGAKYFIGGTGKSAIIKTNTNFLNSTFIIDDTNVENREASIFSVESNLNPISIYGVNRIKKNQDKIFEQCNNSYGSFLHDFKYDKSALEVSKEERNAFYEKLWNERGFALWLGNYSDLLTDEKANHTISEFVRDKIRSQVNDPVIAEKLCPKDHGFGTRRVPCESGYYKAYNQPNVCLLYTSDAADE